MGCASSTPASAAVPSIPGGSMCKTSTTAVAAGTIGSCPSNVSEVTSTISAASAQIILDSTADKSSNNNSPKNAIGSAGSHRASVFFFHETVTVAKKYVAIQILIYYFGL